MWVRKSVFEKILNDWNYEHAKNVEKMETKLRKEFDEKIEFLKLENFLLCNNKNNGVVFIGQNLYFVIQTKTGFGKIRLDIPETLKGYTPLQVEDIERLNNIYKQTEFEMVYTETPAGKLLTFYMCRHRNVPFLVKYLVDEEKLTSICVGGGSYYGSI